MRIKPDELLSTADTCALAVCSKILFLFILTLTAVFSLRLPHIEIWCRLEHLFHLYLLSQFLLTCPFFKQTKQQANFFSKPRLASTLLIFVYFHEACCPKQYTQDTLSCPTTNKKVVDSSRICFTVVFTVTDEQRSLAWSSCLKWFMSSSTFQISSENVLAIIISNLDDSFSVNNGVSKEL